MSDRCASVFTDWRCDLDAGHDGNHSHYLPVPDRALGNPWVTWRNDETTGITEEAHDV